MKKFNNFFVRPCYLNKEVTMRAVCKVICDNMENDSKIAALGVALGLTKNANKKTRDQAISNLHKILPYYAVTKVPSQDGRIFETVHIVRLVPTSRVGIYKVKIETDFENFIYNLINDNYCIRGKILKINSYVSVGANGIISENCYGDYSFNVNDLPVRDISLIHKTPQLQFLETKQLQGYPILPINEVVSMHPIHSEEMAYLFTIAHSDNIITMVYENINNSRASFLFMVIDSYYNLAVECIKDYFTSDSINKRSSLIYTFNYFHSGKGFIEIKRIVHGDMVNWQTTIEKSSLSIF